MIKIDLVQTQLEILSNILQNKSIHFNLLIEKSVAVKHVLPCASLICWLSLTYPMTVGLNERSFGKFKLGKYWDLED